MQDASDEVVHCTDTTFFTAASQVEHSLHCVPPTASLKVVPVHAEQTVWPAAEIEPGAQDTHGVPAFWSASASPARHGSHVSVVRFTHVPAPHASHCVSTVAVHAAVRTWSVEQTVHGVH